MRAEMAEGKACLKLLLLIVSVSPICAAGVKSGLWIKEDTFPFVGLPEESVDMIVVGPPPHNFIIQCPITGNPRPTFQWFKDYGTPRQTEVSSGNDGYFSVDSSGTLHVSIKETLKGVATQEWTKCQVCGVLTCVATNKYGSIFWRPVNVTTGYLGSFASDRPNKVTTRIHAGTVLRADPPTSRPDSISYMWYKGPIQSIGDNLRTDDDDHMFISEATGNLYLSDVRPSDAGDYRVGVGLEDSLELIVRGPYDGQTSGMYMWEGRIASSPATSLVVESQEKSDGRPMIDPDFPAVAPRNPPIRGRDFQLECFAYGRLPLTYTWSKHGVRLDTDQAGAYFLDSRNRVLRVYRADDQDSGTYTCTVRGAGGVTVSRSITVNLVSPPRAKAPATLKNQGLAKGGNHTWVCDSAAVPTARYSWYKNALSLDTNPVEDVTVGPSNTLHIRNADAAKHNGMYECLAENNLGKAVYAAQLIITSGDPLIG